MRRRIPGRRFLPHRRSAPVVLPAVTPSDLDRQREMLAEWIASRLEPMHGDVLRAAEVTAEVASGEDLRQIQIDVLSFVAEEVAALRDTAALTHEDARAIRTEAEGARLEAAAAHARAALAQEQIQALAHDSQAARIERNRRVCEDGELAAIDPEVAQLLSAVDSTTGPAMRAGWFINHPETIGYAPGSVRLAAINERIVENPFVFGALAGLEPGSAILDVGSAESTVALSLASLGHHVTALDPRGYPFEHGNLDVATVPLADFDGQELDAVISLSTIEHLGLGHYTSADTQRPDGDVEAAEHIAAMLKPGGLFVLTVPYGVARVDSFERIYDDGGLERLLAKFEVQSTAFFHRHSPIEWRAGQDTTRPGCALIVARRPA